MDFADVRGQESGKRGLLVAMAGLHSVVLIGPPGWGKTMLAQCVALVSPRTRVHEVTYVAKLDTPFPVLPDADMLLEVPPVPFRELTGKRRGTDTATIVAALDRAAKATPPPDMDLSETCLLLMKNAMSAFDMNARQYHIALRVARTIARIDGAKVVSELHLAEAVQHRLPVVSSLDTRAYSVMIPVSH